MLIIIFMPTLYMGWQVFVISTIFMLMRALVQRVKKSQVKVNGEIVGNTGLGLLVLLGITHSDSEKDVEYISQKIAKLRIFSDEQGKMNLDINQVQGSVCIVSQFTLYGDVKGSNRPGFDLAAKPDQAEILYNLLIKKLKDINISVSSGIFRADMEVELINDGPVTLMIES